MFIRCLPRCLPQKSSSKTTPTPARKETLMPDQPDYFEADFADDDHG
jgi:hypothetical protein